MNSATKRHTRDVGLTFPTPASSQARPRGDHGSGTGEELYRLDRRISEGTGKQKRQPSGFLAEKRQRRNQPRELQGLWKGSHFLHMGRDVHSTRFGISYVCADGWRGPQCGKGGTWEKNHRSMLLSPSKMQRWLRSCRCVCVVCCVLASIV